MPMLRRYGQISKMDYWAMCTLPGIVLPTSYYLILTSNVGKIRYYQDPLI